MNIVFLDYDGVVNVPMWNNDGVKCNYNYPKDNKVNNFQAVQWVSEFCQKYGFDIVVTSSWRHSKNYKECLINGGLRTGIKIVDRTPYILTSPSRSNEISEYLSSHPSVENYIIFDDEIIKGYENKQILCNGSYGFGINEYEQAIELINLKNTKG